MSRMKNESATNEKRGDRKIRARKRIIFLLLAGAIVFLPVTFLSCKRQKIISSEKSASEAERSLGESSSAEKIKVVCTLFPFYDWTRQITRAGSEKVELALLAKNGTDFHSFQPSAADIVKIGNCDFFIFAGGESDAWTLDVLKTARNKKMKTLNLLEELADSAKKEEYTEEMQLEDSAAEDELGSGANDVPLSGIRFATHSHTGVEYDEHIWLSLRLAQRACALIAEVLGELNPADSDLYERDLRSYCEELACLDEAYKAALCVSDLADDAADERKRAQDLPQKTLIFCDRFPFRYLTDDYDLKYFAAFAGCSAETEASFETVAFLARKIGETNVNAVFITESSDGKLAKTVIANSENKDCKIVALDSLQSVTRKQISEGKTYLSAMRKNLELLQGSL